MHDDQCLVTDGWRLLTRHSSLVTRSGGGFGGLGEGSERAPGWVLEASEILSGGSSDSSVRYKMTPGSAGQLKAGHGQFELMFSSASAHLII